MAVSFRPRKRAVGAAMAVALPLLAALLSAPGARAAITNGQVYADFGLNTINNAPENGGPGIALLCYVDWYPGCTNGQPRDLMWFGTYDYLGVAPAGTGTLDSWKLPDIPANGTTVEPGPGKWADAHNRTMLSGGVVLPIDAATTRIAFTGTRSLGASFTVTLDYFTLPGERTIRVIVNVTNTAGADFDFAYYHGEDVDTGSWPSANNDANGDGNDAQGGNPSPIDGSNGANLGPGDPGDTWDERILPYTGTNWYSGWATNGVWTSGWQGLGVGYITVLDASGQDVWDQTVVPAGAGSDGRPDDYSGLFSFESDIDWYVGRWDAAAYGPGVYVPSPVAPANGCFSFPPLVLFPMYYAWEDVFECDGQYWDAIGNDLRDNDNGVGLLKDLGTIPAGGTGTSVFYIGEPPEDADIVLGPGDVAITPAGSVEAGNPVTIDVTVHSGGGLAVSQDFPVEVYKGDPDADGDGIIDAGAVLLGATTVNAGASPMPPGSQVVVSFPWTPGMADVGIFDVYAVADYQATGPFTDGAVDEANQPFYEVTNNKASEPYQVRAPPEPTPPRDLRTSPSGGNVNLTWLPPLGGTVDFYEIYRGPSPRGIDLTTPVGTTPSGTLAYTDPGVAGEAYYVVRAVGPTGGTSATSNTAGVYAVPFVAGRNDLSLPLEPFSPLDAAGLFALLGATDLVYLDGTGTWQTYPGAPNVPVDVGQGFLADFTAATNVTFAGFPGSMVLYDDELPGFTATEAASLWATVDAAGTVSLSWSQPAGPGVDHYCVWRSGGRDGFHTGAATNVGCTTLGDPSDTTFNDPGAAAVAGDLYYLVVPVEAAGTNGSSSYSVGVWTADYTNAHAFGLPLRPDAIRSVDWYASAIPDLLGIDWMRGGVWVPHFTEMAAGVFDGAVVQARGYQLQAKTAARYSFVGS